MKKRLFVFILSLALVAGMLSTASAASGAYSDVLVGAWYADEVEYVTDNALMNGVGDGLFAPDGYTNRAMLVTILHRMSGSPETGEDAGFSDVGTDEWYTEAVRWAAANGIVDGYTDGTFLPLANICREETAAILYRYIGYLGLSTWDGGELSRYPDAGDISSWASDAFAFLTGAGIINGMDGGRLEPREGTTRAQIAVIIYRLSQFIDTAETAGLHTVTFDYNYGDKGTYTTVTVKDGETVTAPAVPRRSGYIFAGWCTSAGGGDRFSFTTPITESMTLYAMWEEGTVTHIHKYEEAERKEPTCGDDGYIIYECICGRTYTEILPATGEHSWGNWTDDENGVTHTRTCEKCQQKVTEEHHIITEGTVNIDGEAKAITHCELCSYADNPAEAGNIVAKIGDTKLFTSIDKAIELAEENDTITLLQAIMREPNQPVLITKSLTIEGGYEGAKINAAEGWSLDDNSKKHLVIVSGDVNVTLKNLALNCGKYSCGIEAEPGANLTLDDIEIYDSVNAGLIINGADVTATQLVIFGCEWGCINIDTPDETTTASLTFNSGTLDGKPQIWVDAADAGKVTVTSSAGVLYGPYDVYSSSQRGNIKVWSTTEMGFIQTGANKYKVTTAGGLAEFRDAVNEGNTFDGCTISLEGDITLSGDWTPIGTETNPFSGTFDGKEKNISRLKISSNTQNYVGLFGYVKGGTIEDFTVQTLTSDKTDSNEIKGAGYVGTVAGKVENGTVSNVNVTGRGGNKVKVEGHHYAGGLVGYSYNSMITNCSVEQCNITAVPGAVVGDAESGENGNEVGGVAGCVSGGKLTGNSVANVDVSAYRDLGGVAGTACNRARIEVKEDEISSLTLSVKQTNQYSSREPINANATVGQVGEDAEVIGNGTAQSLSVNIGGSINEESLGNLVNADIVDLKITIDGDSANSARCNLTQPLVFQLGKNSVLRYFTLSSSKATLQAAWEMEDYMLKFIDFQRVDVELSGITLDCSGTKGVLISQSDVTITKRSGIDMNIKDSAGVGLTICGSTVNADELYISGCADGCVKVDASANNGATFTLDSSTSDLTAEEGTYQIWSDGEYADSKNVTVAVTAEGYNCYCVAKEGGHYNQDGTTGGNGGYIKVWSNSNSENTGNAA